MRYLILIPAYNASDTISELIDRILKFVSVEDIIVINDGSYDNTCQIAKAKGVKVLSHELNLGKGEALKTGIAYGIAKKYDAIITIDSDLQHPPEMIPDFISLAESYDLVVGKRNISLKTMPFDRWLSNKLTSSILSFLLHIKIPDSQCGFRLIKTAPLKEFYIKSSRFEYESEMIIRFARANKKIGFIEIPTIYNKKGSNIRRLGDTLRFIKMLLKSIFAK